MVLCPTTCSSYWKAASCWPPRDNCFSYAHYREQERNQRFRTALNTTGFTSSRSSCLWIDLLNNFSFVFKQGSNITISEAEEITLWFTMLVALTEDPSLIFHTHIGQFTFAHISSLRLSYCALVSADTRTHINMHTETYAYTHNLKIKRSILKNYNFLGTLLDMYRWLVLLRKSLSH